MRGVAKGAWMIVETAEGSCWSAVGLTVAAKALIDDVGVVVEMMDAAGGLVVVEEGG